MCLCVLFISLCAGVWFGVCLCCLGGQSFVCDLLCAAVWFALLVVIICVYSMCLRASSLFVCLLCDFVWCACLCDGVFVRDCS